jgi:lysophospholipase L1-like esterase
MKRIKIFSIILFFLSSLASFGQKRFKNEVFIDIDSITNIQYGQATNIKGEEEKLLLDVFLPVKKDTLRYRPLIIFIHGGGFRNNSKNGAYSSRLCQSFARRGYVTASINYRLGVEEPRSDKFYAEALYRAQQDGKAAIRFFRRYAEKYGIDTAQIFITGSSAGSMTCLGIAYLNEEEIPSVVNKEKWGTLEGSSGNEGYSSKVHGVMNGWGNLINYKWIQPGDVPLFNVSGTEDKTVAYDSSFAWNGFKYGGYILYQRCLELGVPTGWRPFYATGHTLDNNKVKQDSAIESMSAWLYTQLRYHPTTNNQGVLRWEKDIAQFDSLNKVEQHGKDAILFLGSSYIRMWKNIREDLKYKDIIHRGFGGCNLRDVAFYVKRIVYPHQPKAIFIYVGNDIVAGEKDKSPDQVLELFKYVVKVIREKYPTVPVTWLQISPNERRWAAWDKISEANQLISNYCKSQPNMYYIASSNKYLGKDGKPIASLFLDDKLHYNEAGYKVWGNNIYKQVKKISKTKK